MKRLVTVCASASIAKTLGTAALVITTLATAVCASTLDDVKKRGMLNCGANGQLAGFGLPDSQGNWTGIDVELCRAVAAAIFNDPNKVKFVALSAKDRFTSLQSGDVDLLARNTTWTSSRDSQLGLNATAVNYYDGQGFIVRKDLKLNSALELNDATICVQQGTTTELNLADYFRANKMRLKSVTFLQLDEAVSAYDSGRCNAYTTDASGLYSVRLKLARPDDHVVLPEIISKEPLAPFVRQGDDQWFDVVKWVHYAMINAEELNVTKANVDEQMRSDNPEIKRLLGSDGNFGEQLGLTKDWIYRIVKHVGNYGEVFDRNVGAGSLLKITRGLNALWTKGGLQYAPPIR
jgi:general L-amino acid transport system substrate-binding protein